MRRTPFAALAIAVLITVWIAGAMVLGDYVRPYSWAIQALYYPLAGFAWVFPVRWLMLWGAGKR